MNLCYIVIFLSYAGEPFMPSLSVLVSFVSEKTIIGNFTARTSHARMLRKFFLDHILCCRSSSTQREATGDTAIECRIDRL